VGSQVSGSTGESDGSAFGFIVDCGAHSGPPNPAL